MNVNLNYNLRIKNVKIIKLDLYANLIFELNYFLKPHFSFKCKFIKNFNIKMRI